MTVNFFKFATPFVLVVLFVAGFYIWQKNERERMDNLTKTEVMSTKDAVPFQEMTIPYLRKQNFNSSLRDREKISENGNYTSYLTSYTSDGLKINGLLTKPIGDIPQGGWPAVVFIHGYIPPTFYKTTEKYVSYVDFLAREGFVIFKIDLRGHGNSEGVPGGAYYSPDYIIDVLNAYSALTKANFVNPKKIGLWGHSMAGNVTLRSLAAKPEIPAAVIWAGAVYSYEDFGKYRLSDHSYRPPSATGSGQSRRQGLYEIYGEFDKNHWFWKQVAPTNYLNDLKGAMQIHHAIDDDVVNIGYGRDLVALLDKTAIVHEFYEYQSGGHNIEGVNFTTAMQRTVEFFKLYLI